MLKNYLKIAFRAFRKQKFLSAINIFGLSVGIAACIVLLLFVRREYRVNADIRHVARQYLIKSRWQATSMGLPFTTLAPLGIALRVQYPHLAAIVCRLNGITTTVSHQEKHFRESVLIADSTLFSMFGFPLLHGDPATALQQPSSVVLTEAAAQKYFGRHEVVNEMISIETFTGQGRKNYRITGVLAPIPYNSVLHIGADYEFFVSMASFSDFFPPGSEQSWQNKFMVTFVELAPNVAPEALATPLAHLISANAPPEIRANLTLELAPLRTLYLDWGEGLARRLVLIMSLIGGFVLLIAVFNFMNLSTARASRRMKEIGMRKVFGAFRKQLMLQFLFESKAAVLVAAGLGGLLAFLFLEFYHGEPGRPIIFDPIADPTVLLHLAALVILVGLLSGSYPAFLLSSFNSIESLKGKFKSDNRGLWLRRVLVAFQFAVAIALIIATTTMSRQIDFMLEKDLGYDAERIMVISSVPRDWSTPGIAKLATVKNELQRLPEVSTVSVSFEVPDGAYGMTHDFSCQGWEEGRVLSMPLLVVDENYAETYRLKISEGRFFGAEHAANPLPDVVLNESAARALGWESAVGRQIYVKDIAQSLNVIGVVKDFHFASLHQPIQPLAFWHVSHGGYYRYLSLKFDSPNLGESVKQVQSAWNRIYPDTPLVYTFMDDKLQKLYVNEQEIRQAAALGTGMGLLLAGLGILGLVAMNVAQRTKEIGVRKVLGATVMNVVALFSKDFVELILLASLLACPLAWFAMRRWLENFAYRVEISWWVFALAGGLVLIMALVTICAQVIKAALVNPAESLRYE